MRKRNALWLVAWLALGCGDDGTTVALDAGATEDGGDEVVDAGRLREDTGPLGPICENSACGGDPIGTWTYQSACASPDLLADLLDNCPGTTLDDLILGLVNGTFVVTSSGTFSQVVQAGIGFEITAPTLCVALLGGCAAASDTILAELPEGSQARCESVGGACNCSGEIAFSETSTGTWSQPMPSIITLQGENFEFCIEDGELRLKAKQGVVAREITFTLRQE